jgi:hypothetical protein
MRVKVRHRISVAHAVVKTKESGPMWEITELFAEGAIKIDNPIQWLYALSLCSARSSPISSTCSSARKPTSTFTTLRMIQLATKQ